MKSIGLAWLLMLTVVVGEGYDEAMALLSGVSPAKPLRRSSHNPSGPAQIVDWVTDRLGGRLWITGPEPRQSQSQVDNASIVQKAVEKLQGIDSPDALMVLGDMNFYGNYTHPQDFAAALGYYQSLADTGNATAQFMVGLFHSTGVFETVPVDQAKASLYYTFAAEGGDLRAQMAMGYRSYRGIGTKVDFKRAAYWYEKVGQECDVFNRNGPGPFGNVRRQVSTYSLADEFTGGAYGEGASESSVGYDSPLKTYSSYEESVEYYRYIADENDDLFAHFHLARLYQQGSWSKPRSYKKSVQSAMKCADQVWPKGPSNPPARMTDTTRIVGGFCGNMIGLAYLRGEGVEANLLNAQEWLYASDKLGNKDSTARLGMLMYRVGGDEITRNEGLKFLEKAEKAESFAACWYLAQIAKERGDMTKYEELLQRVGRPGYYDALYEYGKWCASKGQWQESAMKLQKFAHGLDQFHSPLAWAHAKYVQGDVNSTLLGFLIGAEQGYKSAQLNVAYLLDDTPGLIDIRKRHANRIHSPETALVEYTRAAKQGSLDAEVKMGDFYYHYKGDVGKAAQCYEVAADRANGLGIARWNLGWMYEQGVGVEQDFHLAKRYYDLALESGSEGTLPVKLALARLYLKSWRNSFGAEENAKNTIPQAVAESRTLGEQWDAFWHKWHTVSFESEELAAAQANNANDDAAVENKDELGNQWEEDMWVEQDDDFYDGIIVITVMMGATIAVVAWRRRQMMQRMARNRQMEEERQRREVRQQQEQEMRQQMRHHQEDEGEEEYHDADETTGLLHRPTGSNLAHPDDTVVPNLYQ